MRSEKITVKIGKPGKPGFKEVETSKWIWEGEDVVMDGNGVDAKVSVPQGYTAKDLITFLNYGHMLKQRAKARGAETDEGSKKVNRIKTVEWMVENADRTFWNDYKAIAADDVKAKNAYLDDLWSNEPELGGEKEE